MPFILPPCYIVHIEVQFFHKLSPNFNQKMKFSLGLLNSRVYDFYGTPVAP
jgi:hypothetical protein